MSNTALENLLGIEDPKNYVLDDNGKVIAAPEWYWNRRREEDEQPTLEDRLRVSARNMAGVQIHVIEGIGQIPIVVIYTSDLERGLVHVDSDFYVAQDWFEAMGDDFNEQFRVALGKFISEHGWYGTEPTR